MSVTDSQPESHVSVGDVIDGKYRVERVLGAGGMGIVVAAENIAIGSRVALKLLSADAKARPDRLERLRREARAAARLESDHVARVLDLGGLETANPYIAIEYLDGEDLAVMLERCGPLPVPRAVDLVLEACEAIAEAHALGIVHRDLKPANLFLARKSDGTDLVKVLDFGIAKHCEPEGSTAQPLTRTNDLLGSPRYMSPEQLRSSGDVTGRCDVWSLGVVLLELVTNVPAFDAESVADLAVAILAGPLPRPRERRPDLPAAIERAILGCLVRDPAQRTATVAELASKLAPFGTARARASLEVVLRRSEASRDAQVVTHDGPRPSLTASPLDETLSKSAVGTATGPRSSTATVPARAARLALVAGGLVGAVALAMSARSFWTEREATLHANQQPSDTTAVAASPPSVIATSAEVAAPATAEAPPPTPSVTAVASSLPGPAPHALTPRQPVHATSARPTATAAAGAAPAASEPCPDPNCSRK